MNDNLLSSKFLYAVFVVLLGFILVVLKMVESSVWFNFAEIIGGIYVAGNTISKFSPEAK